MSNKILSLSVLNYLEMSTMMFTTNLPSRLKCMLCGNVLINATQTSCGCKACAKCIEIYFNQSIKPCPKCNEDNLSFNRDVYQDNATNKEIANLEVVCPFENCEYVDILKNIDEHISNCEFSEYTCIKCNEKVLSKNKLIHDETICEKRIVICHFCNLSFNNLEINEIHYNAKSNELCEKWIAFCPNKCEIKTKVNLKQHLQTCSRKTFDCPYQPYYCKAKHMLKTSLLMHLQKNSLNHTKSLLENVETIENKVNELNSNLSRYKEFSSELKNIENKVISHLEILNNNLPEAKQLIPENSIETTGDSMFRNGSMILKVADFDSKRMETSLEELKPIISNPFYTDEFGYKLCLKVYPGGFEEGLSSHLSVYSVIMKGDYDDLLSWPFSNQVSFSILDQENGDQHFSKTLTPDITNSHFQKPLYEYNEIFGYDKFLPLTDIIPMSVYYKNDTIYLKISIK